MSRQTENERKFLVKQLPIVPELYPCNKIEQFYVCGTPEIRGRKVDDEFHIGVKLDVKKGIRHEHNIRLNSDNYQSMKQERISGVIYKHRYNIPLGIPGTFSMLLAEIDIYKAELEGLLIVEVEFGSEEAAASFEPPEWFGEEVTDYPQFKNRNLANVKSLQELRASLK